MASKPKNTTPKQRIPANTPAETAAKLRQTTHCYRIYTDGGCTGNGRKGDWGVAGWGATVYLTVGDLTPADSSSPDATTAIWADLWGLVELDASSRWFLGCEKHTNNTGELTGVVQALLWLLFVAPDDREPAVICGDSLYAMEATEGIIEPSTNLWVIVTMQELLRRARERREVSFVHVKGHFDDEGNSRADELAWWGKEAGPFSQISQDGHTQGDRMNRPEPAYGARQDARLAAEQAQKDVEGESQRRETTVGVDSRLEEWMENDESEPRR
jgi:ribonuclease HI